MRCAVRHVSTANLVVQNRGFLAGISALEDARGTQDLLPPAALLLASTAARARTADRKAQE